VGKLIIPLSTISVDQPATIDEVVSEEDLRPTDSKSASLKEAHIDGTVSVIDSELLFQGNVSGVFLCQCDRCLIDMESNIALDVSWLFEEGTEPHPLEAFHETDEIEELEESELEEPIRYFSGRELDLTLHVWEELVLAAPTKAYCTDDCLGLCPQCGVNLNQESCDCTEQSEDENSNSGLSSLKELFPDLPTGPSEE
jgi:uncharacterized protein